jgi:hypothetical protein
MNEHELREMVRESIARHRGDAGVPRRSAPEQRGDDGSGSYVSAAFVRLPLVRGGDDDGNCLIEPAVRCNHCGYCQSYGH